jgi:chromosome partitioning protein
MIITFGTQKGGVGKSTGATNLAAVLANEGASVVLLEADPFNATSKNWCAERACEPDLAPVFHVERIGPSLAKTLETLNEKYDYIIVDCPGRSGGKVARELRAAIVVSDVLLVPCKPSQPDLDTLWSVESLVKEVKSYNSKLKAMLYFSMARPRSVRQINDAKRIVKTDHKEFEILKTVIYDRKIYEDLIGFGLGVADDKSTESSAARKEMKALTKEVTRNEGPKRKQGSQKKSKTPGSKHRGAALR